MNTVHLYMASLPDRQKTLVKAVRSLIDQVDTIQLGLTGDYINTMLAIEKSIPNPDATSKIKIVSHDNTLQDGARFINAAAKRGYCLVCDDDILYPPDFVTTMIKQYEQLPKPGFLTVMGKVLKPRPLKSYYKGWAQNYRTFDEVNLLQLVDIPGCCGILWHTDHIMVDQRAMVIPNSDVCLGVYARSVGFPCYVIPHKADWLKDLMVELPKDTLSIFGKYRRNDKVQTDFINKWMP